MLILIYPHHSRREVNGDSCYVFYSQLITAIHRKRPRWQFVVAFPDKRSDFTYVDDGFFRGSHVVRVPVRLSPRRGSNAMTFDGFWWDELFRKYAFDVVFSNLPEVSDKIANAGETSTWHTPVVSFHHYVIHSSLPYPFYEHLAYAEQVGALQSDFNVFNSDYCYKMFLDNADRLLAPKYAARQRGENVVKLPVCLLEQRPWARREHEGPPLIIYNHRLQSYKRWEVTFRIFSELWNEGLRFKVRYTFVTPDNVSLISSMPFVETRPCPTRGQYLAAIAEGDINVTHTLHETFCISAVESMAHGQVLVTPNGLTFPEITGARSNGYPLLFDSDEQSKTYIRRAVEDAAMRRQWGPVLREHVLKRYSAEAVSEGFITLFERAGSTMMHAEPKGEADYIEGKDQLLRQVFAEEQNRTIREVTNRIYGTKVNGRIPFSSQSMPNSRIMHVARRYGCEFRLINGDMRLVAQET